MVRLLRRMDKRIVTLRKAVQINGNFVVDVELKGATATVLIIVETWVIVEYTISPPEFDDKPLRRRSRWPSPVSPLSSSS